MADAPEAPKEETKGKLKDNAKDEPQGFWTKLTVIAGIIASIAPITAAINGYYSLELEREKFSSELNLKYIDRALDTSKDPAYRESFLRFLTEATNKSDLLNKWAQAQLDRADNVRALKENLSKVNADLAKTYKALALEQSSRTKDHTALERERKLLAEANRALDARRRIDEQLEVARRQSGDTSRAVFERGVFESGVSADNPNDRPVIFSAIAHPRYMARPGEDFARDFITLSGRHFGNKPGYVVEVNLPGDFTSTLFPLKVLDWTDRQIRVVPKEPLPPRGVITPKIYLSVTLDHGYSQGIEVQFEN